MHTPFCTWKRGLGRYFQAPRVVRRFRRDADGATAIEFAMLAAPFFVLLFAIVESSLIFFAGQMLESSVDNVGRLIRTGQLDNTMTEQEFKDAVCNEASLILGAGCTGLEIDLQTAATFDALGEPPVPDDGDNSVDFSTYTFTQPCPEEIVMVTVSYEWPIFTYFVSDNIYRNVSGSEGNSAFRKILLNAIAVFRTEPYPAGTGGRSC